MREMIEELKKNQEHYELHAFMLKWFEERNKTPTDMIAFLTATWIGQMCLNGYKEEFVDRTLIHMKEKWKTHRLNKHKIRESIK